MKTKSFTVDTEAAAEALIELIKESDCDQLAALLEAAFGCEIEDDNENVGERFVVTPIDGEYCGGLDKIANK